MENATLIDLLLDCLHVDPNRIDVAGVSRLTGAEWEGLVALAAKQRVRPLLYQQLKSRGLDSVAPVNTMQALRDYYRRNAMLNLRRCGELKRMAEDIGVDDVPIIILKGLHLAAEVYDNIALREMSDLDILVSKNHLQRTANTLAALGYKPTKGLSANNLYILHLIFRPSLKDLLEQKPQNISILLRLLL